MEKRCRVCEKKMDGIMNNAEKILKKQKEQYDEMLRMTEKGNELSGAKRSKYRDLNSLDVFAAE